MFQKIFKSRFLSSLFLATIVIIVLVTSKLLGLIEPLELKGYDLLYSLKGSIPASKNIVFADIDDLSIHVLGKFPIARNFYGEAIKTLSFFGAKQIVFDIEFPDTSIATLNNAVYQQALKSDKIDKEILSRIKLDPDAVLSQEMKNSKRVFLASAFNDSEFEDDLAEVNDAIKKRIEERVQKYVTTAIKLDNNKDSPLYEGRFNSFIKKKSFLAAIDLFFEYQKGFGYSSTKYDMDGAVRVVPLFIKFSHNNQHYLIPQMSFNAVLDYLNIDRKSIKVEPGKYISFGNRKIPITKDGNMLINWAGDYMDKNGFVHIPFCNLIQFIKIHNERDEDILTLADIVGAKVEMNEQIILRQKALQKALSAPYDKEFTDQYKKVNTEVRTLEKDIIAAVEDIIKTNKDIAKEQLEQINSIITAYKNRTADLSLLDKIESSIIYIGHMATGTTDLGATPVNVQGTYPMVGVHGNVANTILQQKFLVRAPIWLNILIIISLSLFMSLLQTKLSARYSILLTMLMSIVSAVTAYLLFAKFGYWVDVVAIVLAIVTTTVVLYSYSFMNEEKQKKYIKSAFGMYLSPQVIDQMIAAGGQIELSGEEKELTAFFSDVAGFTSISEKLSATELVKLLNEYLTEMCDIIMGRKGTIDKFEGDAIIAFYGAPLDDPRHAYNCCSAAILMQQKLQKLRKEVWGPNKRPLLSARMGINTGKMRVGNMGSKTRMDYTIMGDNVNLSSRLEGVNKQYKTNVILSEYTYTAVKNDFELRLLDKVRVVGKNIPIDIYELLSFKGELDQTMKETLNYFYEGKDKYLNRQWDEAIVLFDKALSICTNDGPSEVFRKRCMEYRENPENFSEVFSLTEK